MAHLYYDAIRDNDMNKVKQLMRHGVSITEADPKGLTPVEAARAQKRFEILDYMLASYDLSLVCPTLNSLSVRDAQPLFIASELLCTAFIQRWITYELPLNIADLNGNTSLHHASINSRKLWLNIGIALLLDNGADPRIKNNKGNTALHVISSTYEIPENMSSRMRIILHKLLKSKANINAQNSLGQTPLHVARMRRRYNCIMHLVQYGADINMEDNRGMTIFDYVYHKLESNDCFQIMGTRKPFKIEEELYDSIKSLVYHAIKMSTLNLYISDKVNSRVQVLKKWLEFIQTEEAPSEKLEAFTLKCQEEKKKLESTRLETNTSLYEVLHMSIEELSDEKKKNAFQEYIKLGSHICKFPMLWYFLELTAKV